MPEMLRRPRWPFWAAAHYNDGEEIVRPKDKGELRRATTLAHMAKYYAFFILLRQKDRTIKKSSKIAFELLKYFKLEEYIP